MPRRTLAPSLLVATPQLQDPNFRRAVVLMVEHNREGSFGFVVNRESDLLAAQVCEELGVDWPGNRDARAAWGGPVVEQSGWVLFGGNRPAECAEVKRVVDGLYVTSSLEVLRRLADEEPPPAGIRFLLGYAGWGPGQLEDEIALGAWMVAPINREAVFRMAPETIWGNVWLDLGINPATLVSSPGVH